MASGPFTLAEIARHVGMSVEEVRFYVDYGLLPPPPPRRSRSEPAAFQAEHVERLTFIRRALAYGLNRDDIAKFIYGGLTTCDDVYRVSAHRLNKLRRARGPMESAVTVLEGLIATCGRTGGRKDCQILAVLSMDDPPSGLALSHGKPVGVKSDSGAHSIRR